MKIRSWSAALGLLLFSILACNLPQGADITPAAPLSEAETEPGPAPTQGIQEMSEEEAPPDLIAPDDLVYQGAFRLPGSSGGSNWAYSGHGLTYYPGGDPDGPEDGYPGSLYGVGHDHHLQVSEISIPRPVISQNLDDLNTARTLQPFQDITGGMITEDLALPRLGLAYLPPQGTQTTGKLHFCWGQHIQDFEASHGWSELDLSEPRPAGPWVFDGYTNYVTNDYLFEIPPEWADRYLQGQRLATGRAREGLWSGRGPALFAYAPWEDGNPPSDQATLNTVTPLLLYGAQQPDLPDIQSDETMSMEGYFEADHWLGGGWLTAGSRAAVVFLGTKALGEAWYGFSNGVVWPHDCPEEDTPPCPDVPEWPHDSRGFWAEAYQAQVIFYRPMDLMAVAQGEMSSFAPQPYAVLDLTPYLIDPAIDPGRYRRDLVGAMAFDRARGLVYLFERLSDGEKSIIHVFQIQGE